MNALFIFLGFFISIGIVGRIVKALIKAVF